MKKTILVLAANPRNTPRLRLEQEIREIHNGLQRSKRGKEFVLKQVLASRPIDVRRAMLDYKPRIVHFCGHGEKDDGIFFENDLGNRSLVPTEALAELFRLFSEDIECVLMNSCYSETQAKAIAEHIDYVVGMNKEIGDIAAIEFAVAFYDALGAGKSFDFAFRFGRNAIQMLGVSEYSTPALVLKNGPYKIIETNQEGLFLDKQIEREILDFNSFYSNRKRTGVVVHIYWHETGLTLKDAEALRLALEKENISVSILEHCDSRPPDSVFIGALTSAQEARTVLLKVPYKIEYIFPLSYPRIQGGDPNGLLIGIGYSSRHDQDYQTEDSKPIKVSQSDIYALTEPEISNTEFQHRLHEILSTKRIDRLLNRPQIRALSFASDGKPLVSGANNGTVHLWDITSDKVQERDDADSSIEVSFQENTEIEEDT
ncbi:MAG: hypothetical protein AAF921_15860 [Cyanobacteria bacterium P01_D01_bin.44]